MTEIIVYTVGCSRCSNITNTCDRQWACMFVSGKEHRCLFMVQKGQTPPCRWLPWLRSSLIQPAGPSEASRAWWSESGSRWAPLTFSSTTQPSLLTLPDSIIDSIMKYIKANLKFPHGPSHLFEPLPRQVTRSSSAAPCQPTPTASLVKSLLSSCSSWTVCGRLFANFHAPLNSVRASWCFSLSTPMPLSLVLTWATAQLRGKSEVCLATICHCVSHGSVMSCTPANAIKHSRHAVHCSKKVTSCLKEMYGAVPSPFGATGH